MSVADQIQIMGQTGPQSYPDGTIAVQRLGRQGDGIKSDLHGRYYEQNYRGKIFIQDSDTVTLASANATKGALGTLKFVNGFFNPGTSATNCVILAAYVATTSGTPAGAYFYNFLADSTINSAATGTTRSANLGASFTSVVTAQVNVTTTNVASGTTAFKQLSVMGGPAAVAAGAGLYAAYDEVAGRIIVPPGVIFGICALGAGTSHIVQSTLMWEEVPV